MESNRDASEQCYNKALLALKAGDIEKARRMAEKSARLFDNNKAFELIEVN